MVTDEDLVLVSPSDETTSPIQERKFKRLKKLKSISESPSLFEDQDFATSDAQAVEEPKSGSGSRYGSEGSFDEENESSFGFDELAVEGNRSGSVAKRTLDFDSITEEVDGFGESKSQEKGIRDFEPEESEKKRPNFEEMESKRTKKKKRVKGVDDGDMPFLPERRTAKERREHLAQLRAESQRLLRCIMNNHETRDAEFKPAPIVQKPISSILEKIRRRKLEVAKKTYFNVDDHDGTSSKDMVRTGFEDISEEERGNDRVVMEVETEETIVKHGISDTLFSDEIKNAENVPSHKNLSPQAAGEEPEPAFRAPVNDTQDLFSDSQTSDSKDQLLDETPSSPLEEVLAPSLLAMNLKLDSAPAFLVVYDLVLLLVAGSWLLVYMVVFLSYLSVALVIIMLVSYLCKLPIINLDGSI